MIIIIKQLPVFWNLFSLESLQFNKWIRCHHWAGNKLAHFPLWYLPRPLDSSLQPKKSFHSCIFTGILFISKSALCFSSFTNILLFSLYDRTSQPFQILVTLLVPSSLLSSSTLTQVPSVSQAPGENKKTELSWCFQNSGGGKRLQKPGKQTCDSEHAHTVLPLAGRHWSLKATLAGMVETGNILESIKAELKSLGLAWQISDSQPDDTWELLGAETIVVQATH